MKKTGFVAVFALMINISMIFASTPVVLKTIPSDNENVDSKALRKINAYFSKPLDVKTVNVFTVIFQRSDGEKLFGKVEYNHADSSVSFVPALPLSEGTRYKLVLKSGIRSREGENLARDFSVEFGTNSRKIFSSASLIGDLTPLANEKGVAADTKIQIRFKEDVDQSTLNLYTFRVLDVSGNVYGDIKYDTSSYTAIFEPVPALEYGMEYKVIVDKTLKFTSGKALEEDVSWSFWTKDQIIGNTTSDIYKDFRVPGTDPEQDMASNNVISAGDLLEITVYNKKGIKEVSEKVRVYLDGKLTFPFAGTIDAAGKGVLAVKKELESALGNFYIEPRVDVWFQKKSAVLESIKITVLGAILKKGSLKVARDTRLIDVLSQVGFDQNSDLEHVQINRNGELIKVDCKSINGDLSEKVPDITLEDLDIVIVPLKTTKNPYVYVSGFVNNPGRYELENNMSVLDAIYLAGWFLGEGKDSNQISQNNNSNNALGSNMSSYKAKPFYSIKLFRKEGNESKTYTINTKDLFENKLEQDIQLEAGDFIKVYEENLNKTDYVYLFGSAKIQGRFQYVSGMTIVDLLATSGGVDREGKWVNIIRKDVVKNKDQVIFVDLRELLHKGKANRDVVLEPTDIVFISSVRYKNVFWRLGDYLERSLIPGISKVVSLDDLLHKLKNLKVIR